MHFFCNKFTIFFQFNCPSKCRIATVINPSTLETIHTMRDVLKKIHAGNMHPVNFQAVRLQFQRNVIGIDDPLKEILEDFVEDHESDVEFLVYN